MNQSNDALLMLQLEHEEATLITSLNNVHQRIKSLKNWTKCHQCYDTGIIYHESLGGKLNEEKCGCGAVNKCSSCGK